MILYLTRHGETEWNTEGRMQGRKNSPLTERGLRQAEALKRRFADVKFDKVYSSPSERALITAKIIVGDMPVIIDDRLMELNMGSWEGLQISYVKEAFPELYKCYWETPHLFKAEGMETLAEILERARDFVSGIANNTAEKVLIVSHGVTLKAIMHIWESGTAENFWGGSFFSQTAVSIVKCDDRLNGLILESYDTSHLSDDEESSFSWKK